MSDFPADRLAIIDQWLASTRNFIDALAESHYEQLHAQPDAVERISDLAIYLGSVDAVATMCHEQLMMTLAAAVDRIAEAHA